MEDELSGCFGKHGYPNKGTALKVLREREARKRVHGQSRGGRLNVYRCPLCAKWHHGTDFRSRLKRQLKKSRKEPIDDY